MSLKINGNTMRLQQGIQSVGDLLPDTLLDGEAPVEKTHKAGELGNANNVFVSNIADIGVPVKRQRVVLTETKKVDWPLNDLAQTAIWATATFGLEDGEQFGVALVALSGIKHGSEETQWSITSGRGI